MPRTLDARSARHAHKRARLLAPYRPLWWMLACTAALVATIATAPDAHAGGGPQNVLVVINTLSDDSVKVGEYYVEQRGIPAINVCRIACPTDRSIEFDVYRDKIEQPILKYLRSAGIDDHIDYIVMAQDMPVRVNVGGAFRWVSVGAIFQLTETEVPGSPQERMPQWGNPYAKANKAFDHDDEYAYDAAGTKLAKLYLVTYLMSIKAGDAMALVDRSIQSDRHKSDGNEWFYYQDANGNASGRNALYDRFIQSMAAAGFKNAEHVVSGPDALIDRTQIMGYMSGGTYTKLNREKVKTNEYLPGAICDMLQSFGSVPQNWDESGHTQFPVAYMIEAGITGVHGCVAEPYTLAFPTVPLFDWYTQGYNLAETFWMGIPPGYWMNMVNGDPLAQPYAKRPVITVTDAERYDAAVKGQVKVGFTATNGAAPGVSHVEIYVDGKLVLKDLPATAREHLIDTSRMRNGLHELRIVAISSDDTRAQGQAVLKLNVRNDELFVMGSTPDNGAANVPTTGKLRVSLNQSLEEAQIAPEDLIGTISDANGATVTGKWVWNEATGEGTFTPSSAMTAATSYTVALKHNGKTLYSSKFRTTTGTFAFAPETGSLTNGELHVTAGDTVRLRVSARASTLAAVADTGYRGTTRFSCSDAQASLLDTLAFGEAQLGAYTLNFTASTAGRQTLTVRDIDTDVSATLTVVVAPGPFESVAVRAPDAAYVGEPFDVVVFCRDRFGNVTTTADWTGVVNLFEGALTSTPVQTFNVAIRPANEGRAVLRGVVLQRQSRFSFKVKDSSEPASTLDIADVGVPHMLILGPFPEPNADNRFNKAFIDESDDRWSARAFTVRDGLVWRPTRVEGAAINLNSALGNQRNCAAYGLVYVDCPDARTVSLTCGSDDGIKIWINGIEVHANNASRGFNIEDDLVTNVRLRPGLNPLLVKVTQGTAGFQCGVRIIEPSRKIAYDDLVYRLEPRDAPDGHMVSGRIAVANDGVSGVSVELVGDNSRSRTTKTDGNGFYLFDRIPNGTYTITPKLSGVAPASRSITVDELSVADVNFAAPDTIPPTVTLQAAAAEASQEIVKRTTYTAQVADNVGVVEVQFMLDGEPVGDPVRGAPYVITLNPADLPSGKAELTAVARDAAGNQTVSDELDVRIVHDSREPKIKVRASERGRTWDEIVTISIEADDKYGIATVSLRLNGQAFGQSADGAGAEEFVTELTVDPTTLEPGDYVLTVVVTDVAGNVAEKTIRFKVSK